MILSRILLRHFNFRALPRPAVMRATPAMRRTPTASYSVAGLVAAGFLTAVSGVASAASAPVAAHPEVIRPLAFDGGDGTANDPFQISTCAQLVDIGHDLTASYVLTQSFSCAAQSALSPNGFPIGPSSGFSGTLDGNGHSVSDLTLSCSGACGMFRQLLDGAAVRNLVFTSLSLTQSMNNSGTGAVASYVGSGGSKTVSNVSVAGGTVAGTDYTGSIIGQAIGGTYSGLSSSATVSGKTHVGGLIGQLGDQNTSCISGSPSLTTSNFTGSVVGEIQVGGAVGAFQPNRGALNGCKISDVTNTGTVDTTVSATQPTCYVGGIVGLFWESELIDVTNSGRVGASCGTRTMAGGIVGSMSGNTGENPRISKAANSGEIGNSSGVDVGGIVGICGSNFGYVERAYNTGIIRGTSYSGSTTGGISGENCRISDSFAYAPTSHDGGGISGTHQSTLRTLSITPTNKFFRSGTATSCTDSFRNTDDGTAVTCTGLTGKTTVELKTQSTFTSAAWDFSCINPTWAIDPSINNGYPFLVGVGPLGANYTSSVQPVSMSATSSSLGVGQTAVLTFELCEAPSATAPDDFTLSDITVTGGSLAGFASTSATTFTATFTPTPNSNGSASFSIGANAFKDVDGNSNGPSSPLTISYDTRTTPTTTSPSTPVVVSPPVIVVPPSTTTPSTSSVPSPNTPPVPVVVPAQPVLPGDAVSRRADGSIVSSRVQVQVVNNVSTITILNEDGSEITVTHQPTLIRTNYTVYRGTSLTISGDRYQPETDVGVWLNSSPTFLGSTSTTADGAFSFDVVIPGDFELGEHVLQVEGAVVAELPQSTFVGLLVLDRSGPELPDTGQNVPTSLALLMVTVGLALLVGVSQRRTLRTIDH